MIHLSERDIQQKKEWDEIEDLVMLYKEQFKKECSEEDIIKSEEAAGELLTRFSPLFKKYIKLLKGGPINYSDNEMKMFIYLFVDDSSLHKQLKKRRQSKNSKKEISKRFDFIRETYGSLPEEEIELDLYVVFLTLAKRYKQKGRSFCGYVYNSFKFETARFIKKYIKNPINIDYKMHEYKEWMNGDNDEIIEDFHEDFYHENQLGLPNLDWMNGSACSEEFQDLSNLERNVIVKYYLEEWNDRQIAESIGMSISTVNKIRKDAAMKIAKNIGKSEEDIVRRRKTGI